jgi:hypothetical protein
MSGFSATDLGIVSPRLAALKRRGAAGKALPPPALDAPASIEASDVARLTRNVANADVGGTFEQPTCPVAAPLARRRDVPSAEAAAGTRSYERRWRDASIILVERRRGDLYKYGSIAVCAALWAQVFWMFLT